MLLNLRIKIRVIKLFLLVPLAIPNLLLAQKNVLSSSAKLPSVTPRTANSTSPNLLVKPNSLLKVSVSPLNFYQDSTEVILSKMSLDEKIGQLLMIGFPQSDFDNRLNSHIINHKFGSFLLFRRNISSIENLKKLNNSLINVSYDTVKIPPIIAIDQEGGNVARIQSLPNFPFFFHFSDVQNTDILYEMGNLTGRILSDLNINLNLSPVLDLANYKENNFMGLRSFGTNPQKVSSDGFYYSRGLLQNHIAPTAKHFPGIGAAFGDPHNEVSYSKMSFNDFVNSHLKPFSVFSKLGPNTAIMTSHFIYPNLDPTHQPATFSKYLLTQLLREKMNYQGVIITDDLQMKGSANSSAPEEAAVMALQAGADIVMLSWSFHSQRNAVFAIKNAILNKKIDLSEINKKVMRILTLKKWLFENKKIDRTLATATSSLGHNFITSNLLKNIVSKIIDIKFTKALGDVKKISANSSCVISDNFDNFSDYFHDQQLRVKAIPYSKLLFNKNTSAKYFFENVEKCDLVYFIIENKQQLAIYNNLKSMSNSKVIVFNFTLPKLLLRKNTTFKVIDLYGLQRKVKSKNISKLVL